MTDRDWGRNWLAAWISTPPVRNRTARVTTVDSYDDPIVIMAHFDTATGWRAVCDSRSLTVTHWMALPPLPPGVSPRWARLAEQAQP